MQYFVWVALAWTAQEAGLEEVVLLRSDDIRVRESAGLRLAGLPYSRVPALRKRAASEADVEVHARLMEAVRSVCDREATRLLGEGRVQESLVALASAEADGFLDDFVRRTKAEVETEIQSRLTESPCMEDCSWHLGQISEEFRAEYGPWGLGVLVDAVERQDPRIPAFALLREREEVLPWIVRSLRQGSPALRNDACALLHAMVFLDGKSVDAAETLTSALESLADDPAGDPGTRMRSRSLLDRLTGCGP